MSDVVDSLGAPLSFVVTGVMAAGKSTVADLLARRFERSVYLRGDVFRRLIVRGGDPIAPPLGPEAMRQLARQRLAAMTANEYWRAGFTVVLQDIYSGPALGEVVGLLETSPLFVEEFRADFAAETPRLGLWLDTSAQSPEETVDEIVRRSAAARVR